MLWLPSFLKNECSLQVCCPTLENLDYIESGEKLEYDDGYEYEYEHIYECDNVLPPIQCPEDKTCASRSNCGNKGTV